MTRSSPRRVVSLLPGATEWVAALGAADRLVGISHECDHPATITDRPRVTTTPIDPAASSQAIDLAVRAAMSDDRPVIGIDAAQLAALRPDLLITQRLCDVCAVADGEAHRLAAILDPPPAVLSLEGRTVRGVLDDGRRIAAALGVAEAGKRLVATLAERLAVLGRRTERQDRPGVVVIEWLAPCFLAGHWTPELVHAAGGRDLAMCAGEHSIARHWNDVTALDPAIVVIALCGFDEARARAELAGLEDATVRRWLDARRTVVIDGNAYTSRAGPRIVEAAEVLAKAIGGPESRMEG